MLRNVKTLAVANIQVAMTYKVNFVLGILSTVVLFFVHFNLWKIVFEGNNASTIGGYTFPKMIMYVAMSRILYVFVNSLSIEEKVAGEIKDGNLSVFLVKPMNYLLYNISAKIGNMILQFIISIVVFFTLFFIVIGDLTVMPGWPTILIVIVTALGGMVISTLIGYIFALSAFWIEQVGIMFVFKRTLLSFISGVWIPISFFPSLMRKILDFLPFNYLQYFSVNIYMGNLWGTELIKGVFTQIIWIVLLYLISIVMWVRGIKKYTSVGG